MELFGLDFQYLLLTFGSWLAFGIILAESSVVFFLPGDSFLFAAGLLASQGHLNLWQLLVLTIIAAIAGNSSGYWLGHRFGRRLFTKEDSLLFSPNHIHRTEVFYAKYGPSAVILARFVPFVRTFVPILAGVGRMNYRQFLVYNIIGAILWIFSMTLLGYWLGTLVPNIDRYVLPIVLAIIGLSIIPPVLGLIRSRR